MNSILKKIFVKKKKYRFVTIVSGLPRSGTSMMMQMLEAGGMPIIMDNLRKPDDDNPLGYYEFENVKKIKEDASWLKSCQGKAFKMVSALLYDLPPDNKYKVIFMKREMEEVLVSQGVMLERMGRGNVDISDAEMADKYVAHLQDIMEWISKQSAIDVLEISYNDVIEHPQKGAMRVNSFLGEGLKVEKMSGVVEASLYRQRKKPKHSEDNPDP